MKIAVPQKPAAPPAPFEMKVTLEEIRKRKLFVATPMYGGMCYGNFAKSIADLATVCFANQIECRLYFLFNESLITRARNYCADEFMRSGFTHLLFLDSDIGFNPKDMIDMLAIQGPETPYDILASCYPKKCISWEKIKVAVDKGFADEDPNQLEKFVGDYVFNPKYGHEIPIGAPAEVLEAGTGCMMIRRETFEKINEAFPELLYKPDHVRTEHFDGTRKIMQYFQAEIDNVNFRKEYQEGLKKIIELKPADYEGAIKELIAEIASKEEKASLRYLSEDYWFNQLAGKIGLRTWICPWVPLTHTGTMTYAGSLIDMARLGVSATADKEMLKKK